LAKNIIKERREREEERGETKEKREEKLKRGGYYVKIQKTKRRRIFS